MPISNTVKGLHNLRTLQSKRKDADIYKENADYLKLFMLEKERTRLHNEQIRLVLRLDTINSRIKEIEEFYDTILGKKEVSSCVENKLSSEPEEKKEWKTIPIKY